MTGDKANIRDRESLYLMQRRGPGVGKAAPAVINLVRYPCGSLNGNLSLLRLSFGLLLRSLDLDADQVRDLVVAAAERAGGCPVICKGVVGCGQDTGGAIRNSRGKVNVCDKSINLLSLSMGKYTRAKREENRR